MPKSKRTEDIAVALSGGGHRAALFGLGVLLALVDRGLNARVKQMASVSGGSILNAFVALHCDFAKVSREGFDDIASIFVGKVVNKGVLTRSVIASILGFIILPAAAFIGLALRGLLSWFVAAPLVAGWLGFASLWGLFVEWLIELRYFPPHLHLGSFPPKLRRERFADLPERSLEHVICCTDLTEARPVFFSTGRLSDSHSAGVFGGAVHGGWTERVASHVPLACAVRASAAFPGIPPRRFRFTSSKAEFQFFVSKDINPSYDPVCDLKKTMFLVDGGVWNNLGSHVFRERNESNIWQSGPDPSAALLIADASAPLPPQTLFPYYIPPWALLRSLLRIVNIQHVNTVEPRISPMQDRRFERVLRNRHDETTLPVDIPVNLTASPIAIWNVLLSCCYETERRNACYSSVAAVRGSKALAELFLLSDGRARIGTHLDRVCPDDAVAILVRGYLNAYLWSIELKSVDDGDISSLETIAKRLRRMAKREDLAESK